MKPMNQFSFSILLILAWSFVVSRSSLAEEPPLDPKYPFRTDYANRHLPWYQPQIGEFPPHHSDTRIDGELISADYIHRKGQFRAANTGEITDFTLLPHGCFRYLNAEADLRDVPLGTSFLFFLHPDADGRFTQLSTAQDSYSINDIHAYTFRLDEIKLRDGKLHTTAQILPRKLLDQGQREFYVTEATRVWKDRKVAKLTDLAIGDSLLLNLNGKKICTDIWAGPDTHAWATEQQQAKWNAFVKARGLPGWIDHTQGNHDFAVILFSNDVAKFQPTWMADFKVGDTINCFAANRELRTWNVPVDGEGCTITAIEPATLGVYGSSSVRLVLKAGAGLLEGFRKGRCVRLYGKGWPMEDFFGESLMNVGLGLVIAPDFMECQPKHYPEQFPYRTDHGNAHLPWYQPRAGTPPPRWSEHLVLGELVKADAAKRSGQFRTEGSGALVDFNLLDSGARITVKPSSVAQNGPPRFIERIASVRLHDTDVSLADLPPGMRYRFSMYPAEKSGAFTQCSLIIDEHSYLAQQFLTYRITSMDTTSGTLEVAWQHPTIMNYNGDLVTPPDFGRSLLYFAEETRVWKDKTPMKHTDLKLGDALRINLTSEQKAKPTHCTDIWIIGPE